MRQPLILSRAILLMATVAIANSELRAQSFPEFLVPSSRGPAICAR
jgi:hypothetical protein